MSNLDSVPGVLAFLVEASRYFANRPTGGEDAAHWSNVCNSENCTKAAALIEELAAENAELQRVSDLQWDAMQRGIGMWQEATGRIGVWPDQANHTVWMLDTIDKLQAERVALLASEARLEAEIARKDEALSGVLGVIDSLFRKYAVELDSDDVGVVRPARAAHLDKADKQNREVLALLADAKAFNTSSWLERAIALLRANLLPDPVDPDLLEARALFEEFHAAEGFTATAKKAPTGECDEYGDMKLILAALKRGRELAKEHDRG